MKCSFTFILLYLLTIIKISGQSSEGTDFWLAFMEHRDTRNNSMVLMLSSRYNTSGTVSMPKQNWSRAFTITANEVNLIAMPLAAETMGSESISTTGIHITSEQPISVYAHQYANLRSEAALILPTESTGTEYYVMSYPGVTRENTIYPSEFAIVASEDETTVEITLADRSKRGRQAGASFTRTLNAGETLQIQAAEGEGGDLSGSKVIGDKPFALLSGARWTQVPAECTARDNLYEQMYPISTWGKQFAIVPFKDASFDVIRILAAEEGTEVRIDNQLRYTLKEGEYVEYNNRQKASWLEASKPVMVAQYAVGRSCNGINSVGDPSMVLLNAVEQTRDSLTIYSSAFENISRNFINLIIPTVNIDAVSLDGELIDSSLFASLGGNSDYSYVSLEVNSGTHNLVSSGCGIIATAYGYGNIESYAYSGGAAFRPINASPLPEGGCLNDTIFFDTGLPPERVSLFWDFGDGTTSNEYTPTHIYNKLGSYPASLVITDYCQNKIDTFYQDLKVTLRQDLQAGNDTLVCVGEPIPLFASDLAGARFEWKGPNGFFSEEQYPVLIDPTPEVSGVYEAVGIISGCATFPQYVQVEVPPLPTPNLKADTTICKEGPIELKSTEQVQYRWQDGTVDQTYTVTEPGFYWVEVVDKYSCVGSDSVLIKPRCPTEWFFSSAFSPNGDGINDIFTPQSNDFVDFYLKIYNRWGQLLFETRDPSQGWDGKGPNGIPVPEGVYVWMIDGVGQDILVETYSVRTAGTVTVIR